MQQLRNKEMQGFLKIIYGLMISLAIVLTFSCIFQIVGITQDKYLAHLYQEKINTIEREKHLNVNAEVHRLSLVQFEEMARERNFVDAGSVTYLRVPATEVVVR
jgi:hypothetical protein